MRRWRKMTWAIVLWTGLFVLWAVSGLAAVGETPVANEAEEAGRAVGATLGLGFLFFLWLIGFVVLAIIWFMSRPRENVVVYGPSGQQVTVTEKDAKRRVEKEGWSYRHPGSGAAG